MKSIKAQVLKGAVQTSKGQGWGRGSAVVSEKHFSKDKDH
jgi:hypothetical protein